MGDSDYFIMLLEDSKVVRELIKHDLSGIGCTFLEAASVEAFKSSLFDLTDPPDLFLVDLVLPDGDGLFVIQGLCASPQYRDIPVLVLTADDSEDSLEECFTAGADDYIHKPWKDGELRTRVHTLLERRRNELAVRLAKQEWERTFDAVPEWIAILDVNHRIRRVNRAMAERLGMPADSCLGKSCCSSYHRTDHPLPGCPFAETIKDGQSHAAEMYDPIRDEHHVVSTSPVFGADGSVTEVVHVARDVTGEARLRVELERQREILDRTQSLAQVAGWDWNMRTGTLFWSREHWVLFDLPSTHVPDVASTLAMYKEESRARMIKALEQAKADGSPFEGEFEVVTHTGRPIWVRVKGQAEFVHGIPVRMFGSIQDITEKKGLEERLQYDATHDLMTGLKNRATFLSFLEAERANAHRYSAPLTLCLADIDHFKKVNDTYGHQVGDAVLVRFAEILVTEARESDLIARYGGEEFALLLPFTDGEGARICVERARATFAREVFKTEKGDALQVTATFGLATYRDEGTVDAWIRRADDALYRGKAEGRNRVVVADGVELDAVGGEV